MSKRQFGFYSQSNNTFIAVESEEDFKKLLDHLLKEEKAFKDREFKERLEKESFDDFDYLLEEVAKKSLSSSC